MKIQPPEEPVVTSQIWKKPVRDEVPQLSPPFFEAVHELWPDHDVETDDIPWDRIYPLVLREYRLCTPKP